MKFSIPIHPGDFQLSPWLNPALPERSLLPERRGVDVPPGGRLRLLQLTDRRGSRWPRALEDRAAMLLPVGGDGMIAVGVLTPGLRSPVWFCHGRPAGRCEIVFHAR